MVVPISVCPRLIESRTTSHLHANTEWRTSGAKVEPTLRHPEEAVVAAARVVMLPLVPFAGGKHQLRRDPRVLLHLRESEQHLPQFHRERHPALLAPLPHRAVSSRLSRSKSFTRAVRSSSIRQPVSGMVEATA
jgi:hypothetical protein